MRMMSYDYIIFYMLVNEMYLADMPSRCIHEKSDASKYSTEVWIEVAKKGIEDICFGKAMKQIEKA
jgi:hypothetical protein